MANVVLFSNLNCASSASSPITSLSSASDFSIVNTWVDETPTSKNISSVNVGSSELTVTNHGFLTGLTVRLSSTNSLPQPLLPNTNYYAIVIDANTIQLAATKANAVNITPVYIILTTEGSGNSSVTPTPLSGTIQVMASVDGTNFAPVPNLVANFSIGNGNNVFPNIDIIYSYVQLDINIISGQVLFNSNLALIQQTVNASVTVTPSYNAVISSFGSTTMPASGSSSVNLYTVSGSNYYLQKVEISSQNAGAINLLVNSSIISTKYIGVAGPFNPTFEFGDTNSLGLSLNSGDVISISGQNASNSNATLNGRAQIVST